MLDISGGIDELGSIKWDLLVCLLVITCLVFICVFRGIKSVGKAVYVTIIIPYVLLTILIIRGLTLPGAALGIKYYLIPEWHKLLNYKVWIDACGQIMFSLGLAMGTIISYSSFNKFHNKCIRDAMIVTLVNSATSLYGGFAVFSVVGYMVHSTGIPVEEIASQGPGLAFVAYPEAMAQLPLPPLWSAFFFTTLLMLGLNSAIGNFEAVCQGVVSLLPKAIAKKRIFVTAICCTVFFLIQLPTVTRGGMYIYVLIDWFAFSVSLVPLCLGEVGVVVYIYGIGRYYRDLEMMFGRQPSLLWAVTWGLVTPAILLTMCIVTSIGLRAPLYGDYVYPGWSVAVGWLLALAGLFPVPLVIMYYVIRGEGSLYERLVAATKPAATWGPSEAKLKADYNYDTRCRNERHWSVRMRLGGRSLKSSADIDDPELQKSFLA